MLRVEERECLEQAAGGVEQQVRLVGDADADVGVAAGVEQGVVGHALREVVHVDHGAAEAFGAQVVEGVGQQRLSAHFHKGFGRRVGYGGQACAQSGGEYHGVGVGRWRVSRDDGVHSRSPCSRCLTTMRMPAKRSASRRAAASAQ